MTNIVLRVKDDRKVDGLVRFLRDIDFLDVNIECESINAPKKNILNRAFGIWKHKNVSLDSLRHKAWRH